ncbi:IPT/TIG domain-containing protein [Natronogracilivirga saccharolytica]|uniref:IPT/TIG domain-containing protein n=1 Tax=Natronogracilivirga saccharolytica TaxID=2812953 RepID=A0A8J7RUK6_9BACT|nr:IPT/TIG domain-containing protein [Natronogracilivirga saccharolytica]MBP3193242.1 IPT/TIG domain-containing protein [Natronogracilivirga saccharolytica]
MTATLQACTEDSNVIFDPEWQGDPDPVISETFPENTAYAGIGSITPDGLEPVVIMGEDFGANPDDVIVYFGTSRATILELQSDRILVTPPDDPGNERRIRVVRIGSEQYSETDYSLRSVFTAFPGFESADEPRSITTDFNGELIAVNILSDRFDGMLRMDRDGERENLVDGEDWTYYKVQHGPDGALYSVRGATVPIIYKAEPGQTVPEIFLGPQPDLGGNRTRMQDLEFDQNGFMWSGGRNGDGPNADLVRIDLDSYDPDDIPASVERFRFEGDINAIRVHDGYLYAAAIRETDDVESSNIYRFEILADNTLGNEELYLQLPGPEYLIRDMVFTVDGDMVLATDTEESVLVYRNNQLEELYPGIVPAGARDFAVSSIDPTQLLVNIVSSEMTEIIILEMEQEMAQIYGTF